MSKDYGQFCGLAKAAQPLGERWALLVIRDLTVGPRRFTDLEAGLPGVPTSVLTARLRELESHGIVERRLAERGDHAGRGGRGVVYALTPYGAELTPILDALGRWGARRMAVPTEGDTVTDASLAAALHAAYRPGVLGTGTTILVRSGPATAWVTARGGDASVGTGEPSTCPDLTITAGPQMRSMLAGRLDAGAALASGAVEIDGTPEQLEAFTRAFHVPLDDDVVGSP